MVNPLPPKAMIAYSKLWVEFGDKPFSSVQGKTLLKKNITQTVYELRKAGWLIDYGFNAEDSRKRTYQLINPVKTVQEINKLQW